MRKTVNARIPPRVEQKLAEYCVKQGVTRSEALVRALDSYLDASGEGVNAYALAADLIPEQGTATIQSENVRELARKAFRGTRSS